MNIQEMAKHIINCFVNDVSKQRIYVSSVNNLKFIENKINIDFVENEPITFNYIVYLFESLEALQYALRYNTISFDCEYDDHIREMTIRTYHYKDSFDPNLENEIVHELTHMLQYDKGMQKKVDLYDKCVEFTALGRANIDKYYVGYAMYYTFPHEQDAFAQQFFEFLKDQDIPCNKELDSDLYISQFQEFNNFKNARKIIIANYKNSRMKQAINELGFDSKSYLKRINFAYKRFKKKLKMVFYEFCRKNNEEHMTIENKIRNKQILPYEDSITNIKLENYKNFK